MSMSDHIEQQVVQDFFAKKVAFSWKRAKLDSFLFYQSGRMTTTCISKSCCTFQVEAVWHTVLNCCTMRGTEQLREQPQIGDSGSKPVLI